MKQPIFIPQIMNCFCGRPGKMFNNNWKFGDYIYRNMLRVECTGGTCINRLGYNATYNRAVHKWNAYIKKCMQELEAGKALHFKMLRK